MDKVLIVVFDNENKAYGGSKTLQELENEGSIHLYAEAVIVRDVDGKTYVKRSRGKVPAGMAVGLLTGSLIGLFSGPVGAAVGAGVGASGGFLYDMAHLGVGQDFLDGVGQSLKPGKAAIVAEVWEEWMLPVDTKMENLGGVVFRRTRRDSLDRQIEWDITTLKTEIDELETERDRASGETKKKLQVKINTAKAKLQAALDVMQARLESSQQETEAKIQALQEKTTKTYGERKTKMKQRITELQAEHKRRSDQLKDQLKQAGERIKETLGV